MTTEEWRAFVMEGTRTGKVATRIGRRYMGDDRGEEFGARNATEGELLVRLRPAHVLAEAGLGD
jgi:hypothetical protein